MYARQKSIPSIAARCNLWLRSVSPSYYTTLNSDTTSEAGAPKSFMLCGALCARRNLFKDILAFALRSLFGCSDRR
jgi:hypothetical protein